jgi:hypothetical protein
MVTNERQRLYANESRKNRVQGKSKDEGGKDLVEGSEFTKDRTPRSTQLNERRISQSHPSPSPYPEIDPKLSHFSYGAEQYQSTKSQAANGFISAFPIKPPDSNEVKYVVNIIKNDCRIKPRFILKPTTCPGLASLIQHIQSIMDDGRATRSIRILGMTGMVDVNSQSDWDTTIEMIKQVDWMDGEVKCVVEMED